MTDANASQSSLARYFPLHRGKIKPGAHRLHKLLTPWLDAGILEMPLVLVAGTNGKGSTCAVIESVARHCGLKTGLYTSPHLVSPTERIRLNGTPIEEKFLTTVLEEIEKVRDEHLPDATFFEITTAAALLAFVLEGVQLVVCEVGLGGKLDSTNSTRPLVSVLTSVGLDHIEILGPDEFTIALDKAHVSRRNRPLICGALSPDALNGVQECSEKLGSKLRLADVCLNQRYLNIFENSLGTANPWLKLNKQNLLTALCAIQFLEQELGCQWHEDELILGAQQTFWPGRFDVRRVKQKIVIFDAGHNAHGMQYFLSQLKLSAFSDEKFHVVFGCFADKDWGSMLPLIASVASEVTFTGVESERALQPTVLGNHTQLTHRVEPKLEEALDYALSKGNAPILVTGSISLIGNAMEILGVRPFEKESRLSF